MHALTTAVSGMRAKTIGIRCFMILACGKDGRFEIHNARARQKVAGG